MNTPVDSERTARPGGSIVSIVVNLILLYAAHQVLSWNITWIRPAWSDVLWAIDLTLVTSIVVNAFFFVFDAKWFRYLAGSVGCAFSALLTWWLYALFPFDFGSAAANDLAGLILLLILAGTLIGMLVTATLAVVELARSGLRPAGLSAR